MDGAPVEKRVAGGMTVRRILVLRGGAIGDFICTLPALAALRRRWPEAYIELLGYPRIAVLAQDAGLVDQVRSLDQADVAQYFSVRPSFREAHSEHLRSFDLVLNYLYDPLDTVRRNLAATGVKQIVSWSPQVQDRHAVDHLLRALGQVGIAFESMRYPRLQLAAAGVRAGRDRLAAHGARVLAIHPGSGARRKNWGLDRFIELALRVRRERALTPVLIFGDAEDALWREFEERGAPLPVLRGLTLLDLGRVLTACRGYVGNDSGITHLAAAVGIPVVALFGPTRADLWGPRGPNAQVVTAPKPDMASLNVDPVVEAALRGIY